jgi:hypothetical protein
MRRLSQLAASPIKIRPPATVGDDQLKYSALPAEVAGPIGVFHRTTPVDAFNAYK